VNYNDSAYNNYSEVPLAVTPPLIQGFEGTFPPLNCEIVAGTPLDTWQKHTPGGFGLSSNSMRLHFYQIPAGDINDFYLPTLDFSNSTDSIPFKFSVAYARFNAVNFDTLELNVSTDCGSTWTNIYTKWGSTLATAPDDSSLLASFTPTSAQWRHEVVDLTAFNGQHNVLIQVRGISGYGNNVYIDDIKYLRACRY